MNVQNFLTLSEQMFVSPIKDYNEYFTPSILSTFPRYMHLYIFACWNFCHKCMNIRSILKRVKFHECNKKEISRLLM